MHKRDSACLLAGQQYAAVRYMKQVGRVAAVAVDVPELSRLLATHDVAACVDLAHKVDVLVDAILDRSRARRIESGSPSMVLAVVNAEGGVADPEEKGLVRGDGRGWGPGAAAAGRFGINGFWRWTVAGQGRRVQWMLQASRVAPGPQPSHCRSSRRRCTWVCWTCRATRRRRACCRSRGRCGAARRWRRATRRWW